MATEGSQGPWLPYGTKDCSQGFCSIFCPQWCYIFFPPPPPFSEEPEGSSGHTFSPLVIAIIGVLTSAFLLVAYYTVIVKNCGSFDALQRRLRRPSINREDELEDDAPGASYETYHALRSNGLDEASINKITVYRYRRVEGLVDGTDCSVCLSEFREDESLRLLPKCSHAFHLQCIDTWLKSHSNCPLCRANVVSVTPVPLPVPAPTEPPETNSITTESQRYDHEIEVVIAQASSRVEEVEEQELGNDGSEAKDTSMVDCAVEGDLRIIEIEDEVVQSIKRSFSMDSLHGRRVCIADVLRLSMEDEFLAAREHGLLNGAGSSRRSNREHGKGTGRSRGLHCVVSTVPMKRSCSSGRLCFTTHGRGKSSALPL